MTYYDIAVMSFGYFWMTIMLIRLPVVFFDSRIFRRCFKQAAWPYPTIFTFTRVILPGFLGAPFMLYMDPFNFFRRSAAPEIWEAAQTLMRMYGPGPVEHDEVEEPGPKDISLITQRETQ